MGRANHTMEPIEPPWQAIKEWIPDEDPGLNWFNQERDPTGAEPGSFDQPVRRSLLTAIAPRATAVGEGVSATWQPEEIPLGDGRILILDDGLKGRCLRNQRKNRCQE